MKIIGFYHIYMANHWQQIVTEQLTIMVRSGLYRQADRIYIGCVGGYAELEQLKAIISPFAKIEIMYHTTNIEEFEFCTLRILKLQAHLQHPFYGFYIHTKGASYPVSNTKAYIGGNYWRSYMNYYILTSWRKCLLKLDLSADLCGVKLLTAKDVPAHKLHYSGNFFWFRSQYVQALRSVEQLNLHNRYEAETWIGTGNPKAETLCQDFVDYNTQKIWEDPA